jgi:hypothetical protein
VCRLLSGQRCVGVKVVQGGTLTRSTSKRSDDSLLRGQKKPIFCQFLFFDKNGVKVTQQDCFMAFSPDSWVDFDPVSLTVCPHPRSV